MISTERTIVVACHHSLNYVFHCITGLNEVRSSSPMISERREAIFYKVEHGRARNIEAHFLPDGVTFDVLICMTGGVVLKKAYSAKTLLMQMKFSKLKEV